MSRKSEVELSSECGDNRFMGKGEQAGTVVWVLYIFREKESNAESEEKRSEMNVLMGTVSKMRWVV